MAPRTPVTYFRPDGVEVTPHGVPLDKDAVAAPYTGHSAVADRANLTGRSDLTRSPGEVNDRGRYRMAEIDAAGRDMDLVDMTPEEREAWREQERAKIREQILAEMDAEDAAADEDTGDEGAESPKPRRRRTAAAKKSAEEPAPAPATGGGAGAAGEPDPNAGTGGSPE